MNRRFPNYRPSTALRQAIEALARAKSHRVAVTTGGEAITAPGAVPTNSPESANEAPHPRAMPGREDIDKAGGKRETAARDLGGKSSTDALAPEHADDEE